MPNYIQPDPKQYRMMILNLEDLFPEEHPLSQLMAIIRKLDLSEFDENYKNDYGKGGRPAIPPDRMLGLIIYSLLYGNTSMRNLEREMAIKADLIYLSGGIHIDHSSISIFRKRHEDAIKNLFKQTVFLANEAGIIDFNMVAIDGSKIKANANIRDNTTKEEFKIRYENIKKACEKRYKEWVDSDNEEDEVKLKKRLEKIERKKIKIEEAIRFLEENPTRKRTHLYESDCDFQKDKNNTINGYNVQIAVDQKKSIILQQDVGVNPSDTVYTVEMIEKVENLKSLIKCNQQNTKYTLDSGYASAKNLEILTNMNMDIYMPDLELAQSKNQKRSTKPINTKVDYYDFLYLRDEDALVCSEGHKLEYKRNVKSYEREAKLYVKTGCQNCPIRLECVGPHKTSKSVTIDIRTDIGESRRVAKYKKVIKHPKILTELEEQMREKLNSVKGQKIYSERLAVVEPVFGCLKYNRNMNKFLRKGLKRVKEEFSFWCSSFNIGKILEFTK